MEESVVKKKKHPLRKIWDIFIAIMSILFFILIFAIGQAFQDVQPKEKKVKPSVQVELLQKKVDALYQSKERKDKDITKLYSEIRKAEDSILKDAKANDEKALLKGEIVSLKQDILMLEANISYPVEEKQKSKSKK